MQFKRKGINAVGSIGLMPKLEWKLSKHAKTHQRMIDQLKWGFHFLETRYYPKTKYLKSCR